MLTFKSFINEARRRPDLNPKISVNEFISNHLDNSRPLRNTSVANSFVNFSNLEYTGPNVNPGYKTTPIGIYAYPSEYVMGEAGPDRPMREALPYAADAEYANIFSVKGNIVDLGKVSASEVKEYYQSVTDVYLEYRGTRRGTEQWKEDIDYLELDIFMAAPSYADVASPGGRLWWVTKTLSKIMMEEDVDGNLTKRWGANNLISSWRKLLLEAGIDGAIDSKGQGIIHTNEPTQAVFFSRRSIDKNNRVYNRYSPEDVRKSKEQGELIRNLKSNPEEVVREIESSPEKFRGDPFTDSDFVEKLYPLDPKVQTALLRAFLLHTPPIKTPIEKNGHVFKDVSDSDINDILEEGDFKPYIIITMIMGALIRKDNLNHKIVNQIIKMLNESFTGTLTGIMVFTIKKFAPNMIEKFLSMVEPKKENLLTIFDFGQNYFSRASRTNGLIQLGRLLNKASKPEEKNVLISIILDSTRLYDEQKQDVLDALNT